MNLSGNDVGDVLPGLNDHLGVKKNNRGLRPNNINEINPHILQSECITRSIAS